MPPDSNWRLTKTLLIDRIRRRHLALQRLTGAAADDAIDSDIESCAEDAKLLWALSERIDKALDAALAPRVAHPSVRDPVAAHDEFKTR